MMRENSKFVMRVMWIHIVTYILCGMIFSTVFNYKELFLLENAEYFMRPVDGISTLIGPIAQVIRGLLFGLILLVIKDCFVGKKLGWLRSWGVIVIIGIINTPGPAPFSIEGIIYTQLPLEFHLKGAPEILVQTLLFSIFVEQSVKTRGASKLFEKNRISFISAILAGVMFSFSGIILSLILKIDIMTGSTDVGAFVIMFIAMVSVFYITQWFHKTRSSYKITITVIVYYAVLAIAPTIYNYLISSPFNSWITLVINIFPVIVLMLVNKKRRNSV